MKIYLFPYLYNNMGDDIMIDLVCKRYPKHQFYVYNFSNLENIACKNTNLYIMESPLKKTIISKVINRVMFIFSLPPVSQIFDLKRKKYDVYLRIGGSIFMQQNLERKDWLRDIKEEKFMLKHCKNKFIMDCNFGPYTDSRYLEDYNNYFKEYNQISFRDKQSYHLFSKLKNVQCFSDIVYNLNLSSKPSKTVGISVISLDNIGVKNFKEEYIDGIIQLIYQLLEQGDKVALISFCEKEGDMNTCQAILSKGCFNQKVEIFNHRDVKQSLDYISRLKGMVGTRFHACVLSIVLKIPFVPVIYSKKTDFMLEDMNFDGYRWKIKDGEQLDVSKALDQLKSKPKVDYNYLECSKGHFAVLDRILLDDIE